MEKPVKKNLKKTITADKKIPIIKSDSDKIKPVDKNYRPQSSDKQIGDGSAGMGGTSAI